jgi:hypothetical protein
VVTCYFQSILFTNSSGNVAGALADSSGGTFSLDRASSLTVNQSLNVLSSAGACLTDTWTTFALGNLSAASVNVANYTFR